LQKGIIYGPVNSKRLGRSLGMNLFPTTKKVCSFDCIYCHYGKTDDKTMSPDLKDLPSVEQVINAIEQVLKSPVEFDYLTFSGNGEPMIHPDFAEIVRQTKQVKDKYRPNIPLTLLSNSSCLAKSIDFDTLSLIDNRIFKLDCADEQTFRAINNPVTEIKIKDIIDGLKTLSSVLPITIQTVFIDGPIKNYEGEVFDRWLEAIKKIKPQKIQVYSTDRPVALASIKMISNEKLQELAILIQEKTGIPTRAYPAKKNR
jgi:wyosine [tRNA(Phe)-imidazoG37] synthetase (radical SAM superfamily)